MTTVKKQLNSASKLFLNSKDLQIPTISMTSKYLELNPVEQLKISKCKSWRSYVSKINHKTPIKKDWDLIRNISGKNKSPSYTHLNLEGTDIKATSKTDIADTLGETFCHNLSSFTLNPSERFKLNKRKLN